MKVNEQSAREMCGTFECPTYVRREYWEEREKGAEKIFKELITENSPNLMKNMNLHSKEAE